MKFHKQKEYNHQAIEKKWQKKWRRLGVNKQTTKAGRPKCYVLDMFPYPSGAGLHVGHPRGYIATDIYSRFKKMTGHNILHPMGWDAFGLPAENYAIDNKIHPKKAVTKNIKRYKEQLNLIGLNYDWDREINTTDPKYYKWTQWIFLQFYKKGLAYQSYEPINWCPSCQTGLANEDLENGRCERCGSMVEKKPMRQWMLKITDYADRLLADLDKLPWPESVKESQRNWIGRSEGLLFTAPVKGRNIKIKTFSAHFEAFYADTFVVIAPDHPLLPKLVQGLPQAEAVLVFAENLVKKRLIGGYGAEKEIEGIFTGRYIIDPVSRGDLPIWVASYVLADYGTGIVKASCHDQRDFAFAKKYKIKLKPVLFPTDKKERQKVANLEICYTDMTEGILAEPKEFAGQKAGQAREAIADYAVKKGLAEKKIIYRLKDWVFSRQRYWGEPIPIIYCDKCGIVPVPEKDLPVKLPSVKNYAPTGTGESPLAAISKWVNAKCPKCGGRGRRETNTMPQWAGSSWYYLRFLDSQNKKALVDKKKEKYWSPVDVYVGGTEHVTRHMIYARFWHKFLYDLKVVNYLEPFTHYHYQGLVLAADGRKMSKRFGNVINPDLIVKNYGADTLRIYEMFMGPFSQTICWNPESMIGSRRFLEKVWRLRSKVVNQARVKSDAILLHQTIKKVTDDIESFSFNTAISALMILVNTFDKREKIKQADYEIFLRLLAPLAPHLTEELWQKIGGRPRQSIHLATWPKYDPKKLIEDLVTIVIQINGKTRDSFQIAKDSPETVVKQRALNQLATKKWLADKQINKVIYIPNRLINLVI